MTINLCTSNAPSFVSRHVTYQRVARLLLAFAAWRRIWKPDPVNYGSRPIQKQEGDGLGKRVAISAANFLTHDVRRIPAVLHTAAAALPQDSNAKFCAHLTATASEAFFSKQESAQSNSDFWTMFSLHFAPHCPKMSLASLVFFRVTGNITSLGPAERLFKVACNLFCPELFKQDAQTQRRLENLQVIQSKDVPH